MCKTYQYNGYFLTTNIGPEDPNYITCFGVTDEQAAQIQSGSNIEIVDNHILIIDEPVILDTTSE